MRKMICALTAMTALAMPASAPAAQPHRSSWSPARIHVYRSSWSPAVTRHHFVIHVRGTTAKFWG